ncbi:unnamed protein product [Protopolystoma xenopodis]|uniref:DNA replication factor RFC1 C-terminal domain-containing protein n=1 Tax=Protopolystoma xenopodis TaxID=117903 RepID=A0A448XSJ1_9PLAT|nr:unnamed protein product [Protopolystoma xenopodis]
MLPFFRGDLQKTLNLFAEAAHDIATGDIVAGIMQRAGAGAWHLLPTQAIFSCLRPGKLLNGHLSFVGGGGFGGSGGISFPSWFGRNSTRNRLLRLVGELSTHLRLATLGSAGDPRCLVQDYAAALSSKLTQPLKEGKILLQLSFTRE